MAQMAHVFTPELPKEIAASFLTGKEMPSEMGTVEELWISPQFSREAAPVPSVYLVQDAHGQEQAQHNVAGILQYLRDKAGIDSVFIEGGVGPLDTSLLRIFREEDLNRRVLDALLKKGEIGGPEIFLSKQRKEGKPAAYGLEEAGLYVRNVLSYREVLAQQDLTHRCLDRQLAEIDRKASLVLSPALYKLFKEWVAYEKNEMSLPSYLQTLAVQALRHLEVDLKDPRSQIEWPMLVRLFELWSREPKVDRARASQERQALLRWTREKKLPDGYAAMLETLDAAGKNPEIPAPWKTQRAFWEDFYKTAAPSGFDFKDYPALALYEGFRILESEIDSTDLFKEIDALRDKILAKLAAGGQETAVIEGFRNQLLLKKLFTLTLAPEEFDALKQKDGPLRAGLPQDMAAIYRNAVSFYEQARERDGRMIDNFLRQKKESKFKTSVLVTGGFHTNGVRSLLREHGVSYAILRPRMNELAEEPVYQDSMTDAVSKTPLMASTTRLANFLNSRAQWKGWGLTLNRREALLRDAAAWGRARNGNLMPAYAAGAASRAEMRAGQHAKLLARILDDAQTARWDTRDWAKAMYDLIEVHFPSEDDKDAASALTEEERAAVAIVKQNLQRNPYNLLQDMIENNDRDGLAKAYLLQYFAAIHRVIVSQREDQKPQAPVRADATMASSAAQTAEFFRTKEKAGNYAGITGKINVGLQAADSPENPDNPFSPELALVLRHAGFAPAHTTENFLPLFEPELVPTLLEPGNPMGWMRSNPIRKVTVKQGPEGYPPYLLIEFSLLTNAMGVPSRFIRASILQKPLPVQPEENELTEEFVRGNFVFSRDELHALEITGEESPEARTEKIGRLRELAAGNRMLFQDRWTVGTTDPEVRRYAEFTGRSPEETEALAQFYRRYRDMTVLSRERTDFYMTLGVGKTSEEGFEKQDEYMATQVRRSTILFLSYPELAQSVLERDLLAPMISLSVLYTTEGLIVPDDKFKDYLEALKELRNNDKYKKVLEALKTVQDEIKPESEDPLDKAVAQALKDSLKFEIMYRLFYETFHIETFFKNQKPLIWTALNNRSEAYWKAFLAGSRVAILSRGLAYEDYVSGFSHSQMQFLEALTADGPQVFDLWALSQAMTMQSRYVYPEELPAPLKTLTEQNLAGEIGLRKKGKDDYTKKVREFLENMKRLGLPQLIRQKMEFVAMFQSYQDDLIAAREHYETGRDAQALEIVNGYLGLAEHPLISDHERRALEQLKQKIEERAKHSGIAAQAAKIIAGVSQAQTAAETAKLLVEAADVLPQMAGHPSLGSVNAAVSELQAHLPDQVASLLKGFRADLNAAAALNPTEAKAAFAEKIAGFRAQLDPVSGILPAAALGTFRAPVETFLSYLQTVEKAFALLEEYSQIEVPAREIVAPLMTRTAAVLTPLEAQDPWRQKLEAAKDALAGRFQAAVAEKIGADEGKPAELGSRFADDLAVLNDYPALREPLAASIRTRAAEAQTPEEAFLAIEGPSPYLKNLIVRIIRQIAAKDAGTPALHREFFNYFLKNGESQPTDFELEVFEAVRKAFNTAPDTKTRVQQLQGKDFLDQVKHYGKKTDEHGSLEHISLQPSKTLLMFAVGMARVFAGRAVDAQLAAPAPERASAPGASVDDLYETLRGFFIKKNKDNGYLYYGGNMDVTALSQSPDGLHVPFMLALRRAGFGSTIDLLEIFRGLRQGVKSVTFIEPRENNPPGLVIEFEHPVKDSVTDEMVSKIAVAITKQYFPMDPRDGESLDSFEYDADQVRALAFQAGDEAGEKQRKTVQLVRLAGQQRMVAAGLYTAPYYPDTIARLSRAMSRSKAEQYATEHSFMFGLSSGLAIRSLNKVPEHTSREVQEHVDFYRSWGDVFAIMAEGAMKRRALIDKPVFREMLKNPLTAALARLMIFRKQGKWLISAHDLPAYIARLEKIGGDVVLPALNKPELRVEEDNREIKARLAAELGYAVLGEIFRKANIRQTKIEDLQAALLTAIKGALGQDMTGFTPAAMAPGRDRDRKVREIAEQQAIIEKGFKEPLNVKRGDILTRALEKRRALGSTPLFFDFSSADNFDASYMAMLGIFDEEIGEDPELFYYETLVALRLLAERKAFAEALRQSGEFAAELPEGEPQQMLLAFRENVKSSAMTEAIGLLGSILSAPKSEQARADYEKAEALKQAINPDGDAAAIYESSRAAAERKIRELEEGEANRRAARVEALALTLKKLRDAAEAEQFEASDAALREAEALYAGFNGAHPDKPLTVDETRAYEEALPSARAKRDALAAKKKLEDEIAAARESAGAAYEMINARPRLLEEIAADTGAARHLLAIVRAAKGAPDFSEISPSHRIDLLMLGAKALELLSAPAVEIAAELASALELMEHLHPRSKSAEHELEARVLALDPENAVVARLKAEEQSARQADLDALMRKLEQARSAADPEAIPPLIAQASKIYNAFDSKHDRLKLQPGEKDAYQAALTQARDHLSQLELKKKLEGEVAEASKSAARARELITGGYAMMIKEKEPQAGTLPHFTALVQAGKAAPDFASLPRAQKMDFYFWGAEALELSGAGKPQIAAELAGALELLEKAEPRDKPAEYALEDRIEKLDTENSVVVRRKDEEQRARAADLHDMTQALAEAKTADREAIPGLIARAALVHGAFKERHDRNPLTNPEEAAYQTAKRAAEERYEVLRRQAEFSAAIADVAGRPHVAAALVTPYLSQAAAVADLASPDLLPPQEQIRWHIQRAGILLATGGDAKAVAAQFAAALEIMKTLDPRDLPAEADLAARIGVFDSKHPLAQKLVALDRAAEKALMFHYLDAAYDAKETAEIQAGLAKAAEIHDRFNETHAAEPLTPPEETYYRYEIERALAHRNTPKALELLSGYRGRLKPLEAYTGKHEDAPKADKDLIEHVLNLLTEAVDADGYEAMTPPQAVDFHLFAAEVLLLERKYTWEHKGAADDAVAWEYELALEAMEKLEKRDPLREVELENQVEALEPENKIVVRRTAARNEAGARIEEGLPKVREAIPALTGRGAALKDSITGFRRDWDLLAALGTHDDTLAEFKAKLDEAELALDEKSLTNRIAELAEESNRKQRPIAYFRARSSSLEAEANILRRFGAPGRAAETRMLRLIGSTESTLRPELRELIAPVLAGKMIDGTFSPFQQMRSKKDWGIQDFISMMEEIVLGARLGQRVKQVLPLNQPKAFNSPYSPRSSRLLDPRNIGVPGFLEDILKTFGITVPGADAFIARMQAEIDRLNARQQVDDTFDPAKQTDVITQLKLDAIETIWDQVRQGGAENQGLLAEFEAFKTANAAWLEDHLLYQELLKEFSISEPGKGWDWREWPEEIRSRDPAVMKRLKDERKDKIQFQAFVQFIADRQFKQLKEFARQNNISLMLDIPLAQDGADVWLQPEVFGLKKENNFRRQVSQGVPADPFSEYGQYWQFFPYDFTNPATYKYIRELYAFNQGRADYIRLDHVLGFYRQYFFTEDTGMTMTLEKLGLYDKLERIRAEGYTDAESKTAAAQRAMSWITDRLRQLRELKRTGVMPEGVDPSLEPALREALKAFPGDALELLFDDDGNIAQDNMLLIFRRQPEDELDPVFDKKNKFKPETLAGLFLRELYEKRDIFPELQGHFFHDSMTTHFRVLLDAHEAAIMRDGNFRPEALLADFERDFRNKVEDIRRGLHGGIPPKDDTLDSKVASLMGAFRDVLVRRTTKELAERGFWKGEYRAEPKTSEKYTPLHMGADRSKPKGKDPYLKFVENYLFPKDGGSSLQKDDRLTFGYFKLVPNAETVLSDLLRMSQEKGTVMIWEVLGVVPPKIAASVNRLAGAYAYVPIIWGLDPSADFTLYHPNSIINAAYLTFGLHDSVSLKDRWEKEVSRKEKETILGEILTRPRPHLARLEKIMKDWGFSWDVEEADLTGLTPKVQRFLLLMVFAPWLFMDKPEGRENISMAVGMWNDLLGLDEFFQLNRPGEGMGQWVNRLPKDVSVENLLAALDYLEAQEAGRAYEGPAPVPMALEVIKLIKELQKIRYEMQEEAKTKGVRPEVEYLRADPEMGNPVYQLRQLDPASPDVTHPFLVDGYFRAPKEKLTAVNLVIKDVRTGTSQTLGVPLKVEGQGPEAGILKYSLPWKPVIDDAAAFAEHGLEHYEVHLEYTTDQGVTASTKSGHLVLAHKDTETNPLAKNFGLGEVVAALAPKPAEPAAEPAHPELRIDEAGLKETVSQVLKKSEGGEYSKAFERGLWISGQFLDFEGQSSGGIYVLVPGEIYDHHTPDMNVLNNLAYALMARGVPQEDIRQIQFEIPMNVLLEREVNGAKVQRGLKRKTSILSIANVQDGPGSAEYFIATMPSMQDAFFGGAVQRRDRSNLPSKMRNGAAVTAYQKPAFGAKAWVTYDAEKKKLMLTREKPADKNAVPVGLLTPNLNQENVYDYLRHGGRHYMGEAGVHSTASASSGNRLDYEFSRIEWKQGELDYKGSLRAQLTVPSLRADIPAALDFWKSLKPENLISELERLSREHALPKGVYFLSNSRNFEEERKDPELMRRFQEFYYQYVMSWLVSSTPAQPEEFFTALKKYDRELHPPAPLSLAAEQDVAQEGHNVFERGLHPTRLLFAKGERGRDSKFFKMAGPQDSLARMGIGLKETLPPYYVYAGLSESDAAAKTAKMLIALPVEGGKPLAEVHVQRQKSAWRGVQVDAESGRALVQLRPGDTLFINDLRFHQKIALRLAYVDAHGSAHFYRESKWPAGIVDSASYLHHLAMPFLEAPEEGSLAVDFRPAFAKLQAMNRQITNGAQRRAFLHLLKELDGRSSFPSYGAWQDLLSEALRLPEQTVYEELRKLKHPAEEENQVLDALLKTEPEEAGDKEGLALLIRFLALSGPLPNSEAFDQAFGTFLLKGIEAFRGELRAARPSPEDIVRASENLDAARFIDVSHNSPAVLALKERWKLVKPSRLEADTVPIGKGQVGLLEGAGSHFIYDIGPAIPGRRGRPLLITHPYTGKQYFHPDVFIVKRDHIGNKAKDWMHHGIQGVLGGSVSFGIYDIGGEVLYGTVEKKKKAAGPAEGVEPETEQGEGETTSHAELRSLAQQGTPEQFETLLRLGFKETAAREASSIDARRARKEFAAFWEKIRGSVPAPEAFARLQAEALQYQTHHEYARAQALLKRLAKMDALYQAMSPGTLAPAKSNAQLKEMLTQLKRTKGERGEIAFTPGANLKRDVTTRLREQFLSDSVDSPEWGTIRQRFTTDNAGRIAIKYTRAGQAASAIFELGVREAVEVDFTAEFDPDLLYYVYRLVPVAADKKGLARTFIFRRNGNLGPDVTSKAPIRLFNDADRALALVDSRWDAVTPLLAAQLDAPDTKAQGFPDFEVVYRTNQTGNVTYKSTLPVLFDLEFSPNSLFAMTRTWNEKLGDYLYAFVQLDESGRPVLDKKETLQIRLFKLDKRAKRVTPIAVPLETVISEEAPTLDDKAVREAIFEHAFHAEPDSETKIKPFDNLFIRSNRLGQKNFLKDRKAAGKEKAEREQDRVILYLGAGDATFKIRRFFDAAAGEWIYETIQVDGANRPLLGTARYHKLRKKDGAVNRDNVIQGLDLPTVQIPLLDIPEEMARLDRRLYTSAVGLHFTPRMAALKELKAQYDALAAKEAELKTVKARQPESVNPGKLWEAFRKNKNISEAPRPVSFLLQSAWEETESASPEETAFNRALAETVRAIRKDNPYIEAFWVEMAPAYHKTGKAYPAFYVVGVNFREPGVTPVYRFLEAKPGQFVPETYEGNFVSWGFQAIVKNMMRMGYVLLGVEGAEALVEARRGDLDAMLAVEDESHPWDVRAGVESFLRYPLRRHLEDARLAGGASAALASKTQGQPGTMTAGPAFLEVPFLAASPLQDQVFAWANAIASADGVPDKDKALNFLRWIDANPSLRALLGYQDFRLQPLGILAHSIESADTPDAADLEAVKQTAAAFAALRPAYGISKNDAPLKPFKVREAVEKPARLEQAEAAIAAAATAVTPVAEEPETLPKRFAAEVAAAALNPIDGISNAAWYVEQIRQLNDSGIPAGLPPEWNPARLAQHAHDLLNAAQSAFPDQPLEWANLAEFHIIRAFVYIEQAAVADAVREAELGLSFYDKAPNAARQTEIEEWILMLDPSNAKVQERRRLRGELRSAAPFDAAANLWVRHLPLRPQPEVTLEMIARAQTVLNDYWTGLGEAGADDLRNGKFRIPLIHDNNLDDVMFHLTGVQNQYYLYYLPELSAGSFKPYLAADLLDAFYDHPEKLKTLRIVMAESTGNQGKAVAELVQNLKKHPRYAPYAQNLKAVIFVPFDVSPAKAQAMEALGAVVVRRAFSDEELLRYVETNNEGRAAIDAETQAPIFAEYRAASSYVEQYRAHHPETTHYIRHGSPMGIAAYSVIMAEALDQWYRMQTAGTPNGHAVSSADFLPFAQFIRSEKSFGSVRFWIPGGSGGLASGFLQAKQLNELIEVFVTQVPGVDHLFNSLARGSFIPKHTAVFDRTALRYVDGIAATAEPETFRMVQNMADAVMRVPYQDNNRMARIARGLYIQYRDAGGQMKFAPAELASYLPLTNAVYAQAFGRLYPRLLHPGRHVIIPITGSTMDVSLVHEISELDFAKSFDALRHIGRPELRAITRGEAEQRLARSLEVEYEAKVDDMDGTITRKSAVPDEIIERYQRSLRLGHLRALATARSEVVSDETLRAANVLDIEGTAARIRAGLTPQEASRLILFPENASYVTWNDYDAATGATHRVEIDLAKRYGVVPADLVITEEQKNRLARETAQALSPEGPSPYRAVNFKRYGIEAHLQFPAGIDITEKAVIANGAARRVQAFLDQHPEPLFRNFEVQASRSTLIIQWRGIDKMLAVRFLAEHFGLDQDKIAAVGDKASKEGNDWRMTSRRGGFSVAEHDDESEFQVPLKVVWDLEGAEAWLKLEDQIKLKPRAELRRDDRQDRPGVPALRDAGRLAPAAVIPPRETPATPEIYFASHKQGILAVAKNMTHEIFQVLYAGRLFQEIFAARIAAEKQPLNMDRAEKDEIAAGYAKLFRQGAHVVLPARAFLEISDAALQEFFNLILRGSEAAGTTAPAIYFAGDGARELKAKFYTYEALHQARAQNIFNVRLQQESVVANRLKSRAAAVSFLAAPGEEDALDASIPGFLLAADDIRSLGEPDKVRYLSNLTQLELLAAEELQDSLDHVTPAETAKVVGEFLTKVGIDYTQGAGGFLAPSKSALLSDSLSRYLAAREQISSAA
ncbi:MAG TPA: 4-alpha-glucanotransferase [Verrucomicrobiae bacterium]|nr:4-alpha-glucanotransferase [Verrucomicrobiae bacterium]